MFDDVVTNLLTEKWLDIALRRQMQPDWALVRRNVELEEEEGTAPPFVGNKVR